MTLTGKLRDQQFLWGELIARFDGVRLRARSPVASSSRAARSANASVPIVTNMLVRGAQLLAGIEPAPLAAQPFAVEQMGAGEVGR